MYSLIVLAAFVTTSTAWYINSANPIFNGIARGGCISSMSNAAGSPVVIGGCDAGPTVAWDYSPFTSGNSGPQQLKLFGNMCLDVTDGIDADGTKLQLWTCVNQNTNQQWVSVTDFTFQWAGKNKCIDLTDGSTSYGTQLQIWTCDPNNWNQKWKNPLQPAPAPPSSAGVQLVTGGNPSHEGPYCIGASQNADGASVALESCGNATTWVTPAPGTSGLIKTVDGTKCLDVRNGDASNGNGLQIWSCVEGNTNQLWTIGQTEDGHRSGGSRLVSWAGAGGNKCVDVTNSVFAAGNNLQIWDCNSNNFNQYWFLR